MFYRHILHRHRLLGPWSRAGVLLKLIYVAGNATCISLEVSQSRPEIPTLSQAGFRAGTLLIVNLIPLFAGPHLGFLADLLGVNLSTIRQIHRSAGVMAVLLAAFHTLVAVGSRPSFGLSLPQNLFAVIVSVDPLSHLPTDRQCREHHCWGSLFCFQSPSSADPPMNSSSVHTISCRRSSSMPYGDICLRTSRFPATPCTSW